VWNDTLTSHAALGALMGVLGSPDSSDPAGGDHIMQAVQWMLSASLHRGAKFSGGNDRGVNRLIKVRQHILEHIDDPDLGPNELAAALHMSRRALYLLFKEHRITPSRLIHDMRLERCKDALTDHAQRQRSVTEIACDNGFADSATFSRMFKAQYGKSPSEWRKSKLMEMETPRAQG
jgi:AraC family transcriptional activator of tynA and feaB